MASPPQTTQDASPRDSAEHVVQDLARQGDSVAVPGGRHLPLSQLILAVWHDAQRHHLQVFAGDLAYNGVLALIPFMLFVVLVLRSVHADDLLNGAVAMFDVTL